MDVRTVCLGVLTFGDASGYEIRKLFEEGPFSHFYQAGFGSIYPALNQALADGLVTCRAETQEGRPDKKIYSLTPAGRTYLRDRLNEWPARDRIRSEFLVTLFFAGMVEDDHLAAVYDSFLEQFRGVADKLHGLGVEGVPAGRALVRGLGITVYQAMVAYLEDNRGAFLRSIADGRPFTPTLDGRSGETSADGAPVQDARRKAETG